MQQWLMSGVIALVLVLVILFFIHPVRSTAQMPPLSKWRVVDLTHSLSPSIPVWPGDPRVEIQPWATYAKDGYFINRIAIGEHSGTHWGTPNTFIEGRSADRVTAASLLLSAVVIDIRRQANQNADYRLSVSDVQQWERTHGKIPAGSLVILSTGWQARWNNPQAFLNLDAKGVLHFPGFGAEAVEFLVSQRQIKGLGTDTHGADPGNDDSCGASNAIYQADGLILECLNGLDQLPSVGTTLVIGGLPIVGGSGSPARVLALLPPAA